MRFASLALAATTLFVVTATSALAQNITGKWTGHIDMNLASMPKAQNAQQQQQMNAGMDMIKKMRFTLTLNKNKSFTLVAPAGGMNKTTQTAEGTWTQTGAKGTLTIVKENGKAPSKKQVLPLIVAKDGKTITIVPPGSNGQGKMIFIR